MTIRHNKKLSEIHTLNSFLKSKKVHVKKNIPIAEVHHNLKEVFNEIKAQYFSESFNLKVEWSGKGITRSQSVVRLGYYNPKTKLIKVNKILDSPHVPRYFISFIIYHEMLHYLLPPLKSGSKRNIHHSEFKQKEQEFLEYELAQSFLKDLKIKLFTLDTHKQILPRNLS